MVIVHALFYRLKELAREENEDSSAQAGFLRRVHRRVYYGLLTALEHRIYTDPSVTLAAVSRRTAGLLKEYFQREDVSVIPNGVDTSRFSVAARIARRTEARQRRDFRDGDVILLLIGNDWRNKGLPTILEAMTALPQSASRDCCVGVGKRFGGSLSARAPRNSDCRTAAVGSFRAPTSSIYTPPRTSTSARAGKIPSGSPWPKPWRAACQRLHRFVRVSRTTFKTESMALYFAIRAMRKHLAN